MILFRFKIQNLKRAFLSVSVVFFLDKFACGFKSRLRDGHELSMKGYDVNKYDKGIRWELGRVFYIMTIPVLSESLSRISVWS
jgi:hypothetical protein